jgi:DNA-binding CsgD family transcriptional regulator
VPRATVRDVDQLDRIWPQPLRLTHAEQVEQAEALGLKEFDVLILKALSHGLSEAETAIVLSYSPWYIVERMKHVRPALRAKTTSHAVANALRRGLIA